MRVLGNVMTMYYGPKSRVYVSVIHIVNIPGTCFCCGCLIVIHLKFVLRFLIVLEMTMTFVDNDDEDNF